MTKSVCGGVRRSTLDSLGMRYHKKIKNENFHEKHFFLEKKSDYIFQKHENFQKVTFFEKVILPRKLTSSKNVIGFFFKKKSFFVKIFIFLFLWYLIPKMSNVELLTPPHTLLVTVYVSGIFPKIRKIKKTHQAAPQRQDFPW